jgi:hypothetical protein
MLSSVYWNSPPGRYARIGGKVFEAKLTPLRITDGGIILSQCSRAALDLAAMSVCRDVSVEWFDEKPAEVTPASIQPDVPTATPVSTEPEAMEFVVAQAPSVAAARAHVAYVVGSHYPQVVRIGDHAFTLVPRAAEPGDSPVLQPGQIGLNLAQRRALGVEPGATVRARPAMVADMTVLVRVVLVGAKQADPAKSAAALNEQLRYRALSHGGYVLDNATENGVFMVELPAHPRGLVASTTIIEFKTVH